MTPKMDLGESPDLFVKALNKLNKSPFSAFLRFMFNWQIEDGWPNLTS